MLKYEGKYVAKVTIDFAIPEVAAGMIPFEKMRDMIENQLTPTLTAMVKDEFGGLGETLVTVDQESAELHKAEDPPAPCCDGDACDISALLAEKGKGDG